MNQAEQEIFRLFERAIKAGWEVRWSLPLQAFQWRSPEGMSGSLYLTRWLFVVPEIVYTQLPPEKGD